MADEDRRPAPLTYPDTRDGRLDAVTDRVHRSVKHDARVIREGDVVAVAWGVQHGPTPWCSYLARVGDDVGRGRVNGTAPKDLTPAMVAKHLDDSVFRPLFSFWRHDSDAGPGTESWDALREILSAADVDALYALMRAGNHGRPVLDWLSSDLPHAATLQAFAASHPWLVSSAFREAPEEARAAAAGGSPDAVAEAVLRRLSPDARTAAEAPRLARLMRGPSNLRPTPGGVAVLATLPDAMFAGDDLARSALHHMAQMTASLATVSGRTPRSVMGRIADPAGHLAYLARRGGHEPGATGAGAAMHGVGDMVRAFHTEVVATARAACGRPRAAGEDVDHFYPEDMLDTPPVRTATRILLGERTLPGLLEVSARWHVQADRIARAVAALTAGLVGEGPRLFEDTDLGDGAYLTCLTRVDQLVDEGAAGPDATGALGLDHCVGSYGRPVVLGHCHILSLRRRVPGGYERLSTAEIRYDGEDGTPEVVQHHGRGNSDPSPECERLLALGLSRAGRGAFEAARAFEAGDDAWPDATAVVERVGGWQRLRDAWSFALPRPLRTAGPAELLAYGGEHG